MEQNNQEAVIFGVMTAIAFACSFRSLYACYTYRSWKMVVEATQSVSLLLQLLNQ